MDYIAPEQAEDASKVDPPLGPVRPGLHAVLRPDRPAAVPRRQHAGKDSAAPHGGARAGAAAEPGRAGGVRRPGARLMAKKPKQRFPSAAVLHEELLRWASGEPVLPLDQPGDQGYENAVLALNAVDLPGDSLPEINPEQATEPHRGPPPLPLVFTLPPQPIPAPRSSWPMYVMLAVLGLLLAGGLGLAVYLLATR